MTFLCVNKTGCLKHGGYCCFIILLPLIDTKTSIFSSLNIFNLFRLLLLLLLRNKGKTNDICNNTMINTNIATIKYCILVWFLVEFTKVDVNVF